MRTLEGNWKEASELPPRAENNRSSRERTSTIGRNEHSSYSSFATWEADLGNISGDEGAGEIYNDSSFDETVTPNGHVELRPVQTGRSVTAIQRIIEEGLFHQIMIAFDRMIHSHNMIFGGPQDIERFMSTHLLRNIRGLHNLTLTVVDGTVSCEVGCREQIEMTFDVGINRFPVGRIILDSLNNTARINSQDPFGRIIMASFQERDAPEGWGVQVSVEAERERIDVNYTGLYNSFPGRQLS